METPFPSFLAVAPQLLVGDDALRFESSRWFLSSMPPIDLILGVVWWVLSSETLEASGASLYYLADIAALKIKTSAPGRNDV